MGRIVGLLFPTGEDKAATKAAAKTKGGRPTKAELTAEAESLGIEVPEGATNPEIKALIDEAKAASEE